METFVSYIISVKPREHTGHVGWEGKKRIRMWSAHAVNVGDIEGERCECVCVGRGGKVGLETFVHLRGVRARETFVRTYNFAGCRSGVWGRVSAIK